VWSCRFETNYGTNVTDVPRPDAFSMVYSLVLLLHGKCKRMRIYRTACLFISLLACLAQAVFARCPISTTLTEEQRELEDRSVLLTLELNKSGSVREAKVLRGEQALVPAAIRAARGRKYKDRIVYIFPDPHEMMVQVTFPQDR
jgi:hypothetical protein